MSSVAKKLMKGNKPSTLKRAPKATMKPLKDESSSEGSDAEELIDEDSSDEDSEEDDVSPEALERMMELLGDEADELVMMDDGESGEDDEDDEEGDEDAEMEGLSEDEDEEEGLFEDLDQEDSDVVPVERTTVNDKVSPTLA